MSIAAKIRKRRLEGKLEDAIMNGDVEAAQKAMKDGARQVNHREYYSRRSIYDTKNPLALYSHTNRHVPGMEDTLRRELASPAPETEDIGLFEYISSEISGGLKERRAKRLCNMLGKAILNKDPKAIQNAIDKGAFEVDMTRGVNGGYGFISLERVKDPIDFAKRTGLTDKEGMALLVSRFGDQPRPKNIKLR